MRIYGFFSLLLITAQSMAQSKHSDSALLADAINFQERKFQDYVNVNSPLYNGTSYIKYWNKTIGHPFFDTNKFQMGNISYQEFKYRNIPLKFDEFKNLLVTYNANHEFEMALVNEKIAEFIIGEHQFIHLTKDSVKQYNPSPGYYELLYDGFSKVVVRYHKRIEASLKAEDNTSSFVEYAQYFVFVKNEYHLIESISDFLSLHPAQKAGLKKWIRKEKLNFSRTPAKALVSLSEYFDTIAHE